MPSSLFADLERNGSGGGGGGGVGGGGSGGGETLDDQRALQLALDQLSLLGLDSDEGASLYDSEPRKKSVNMTECVPVPSSEHVAEIVGRQGGSGKDGELEQSGSLATALQGGRERDRELGALGREEEPREGPAPPDKESAGRLFPRPTLRPRRDALLLQKPLSSPLAPPTQPTPGNII